ncbi:MAG: regulatory iron-sulfur-containing complex subunit RicT [Desulfovibrionaceae bacterium]|nr:regulatory iron-sulfur-containing complex subunit RicT [Desulfovibrionaceae bacterium]
MFFLHIKFTSYGQLYVFSTEDPFISCGDLVIASTEQGLGVGRVLARRSEPPRELNPDEIRPVLRRVNREDLEQVQKNRETCREAERFCSQCIADLRLEMKLVSVEMLFDRSKLLFYFTAPTRIDFRELVKALVREYHIRIELRQIGVRHETQMIGAIGSCGMVCCCHRHLKKFAPVTIRMAKEQNLFLNPTKISGICGRLLCCLSYEQENYDRFLEASPRIGKRYQTDCGFLRVLRTSMFRGSVSVLNDANEERDLSLEEWQNLHPFRPEQPPQIPKQESGEEHADQPSQGTSQPQDLMVFEIGPDNLGEDFGDDGMFSTMEDPYAVHFSSQPVTEVSPEIRSKKKKRRKH